jgi:uncharacterized protein
MGFQACNLAAGLQPGEHSFSAGAPNHSMQLPAYLQVQPDGVVLSLKVQPRASKNAILGPAGNELRVKVTAPPVDAAANEALVRLVAEHFDCPRSRVELMRGHTSRHKVVKLHGVKAQEVLELLQARERPS